MHSKVACMTVKCPLVQPLPSTKGDSMNILRPTESVNKHWVQWCTRLYNQNYRECQRALSAVAHQTIYSELQRVSTSTECSGAPDYILRTTESVNKHWVQWRTRLYTQNYRECQRALSAVVHQTIYSELQRVSTSTECSGALDYILRTTESVNEHWVQWRTRLYIQNYRECQQALSAVVH